MCIFSPDFSHEGEALMKELGERLDTGKPLGSFSPSIYDTAWLVRIRAPVREFKWLYPQCFQQLLETQGPDGDWDVHASELDVILNTMAALIAMKEHHEHPKLPGSSGSVTSVSLEERIYKAECRLKSRLRKWDVTSTVHVGFEILVPALLESLEKDGTKFEFQGRQTLMSMNQHKLSKFHPKMLYSQRKTTLVHSLEAFVGKIDF